MRAAKSRCKPGDRALVIGGSLQDRGKVVLVEDRYIPGTCVDGIRWALADPVQWVVKSLGTALNWRDVETMTPQPPVMRRAFCDCDLLPLPDDDGKAKKAGIAAKPKRMKAVA